MRGVTELIREHDTWLKTRGLTGADLDHHLTRIGFLQHERLVHLIVMLFVALCALLFLVLYMSFQILAFLVVFILLLVLTFFYVLHYYRLENTVIRWYFIYGDRVKKNGS